MSNILPRFVDNSKVSFSGYIYDIDNRSVILNNPNIELFQKIFLMGKFSLPASKIALRNNQWVEIDEKCQIVRILCENFR